MNDENRAPWMSALVARMVRTAVALSLGSALSAYAQMSTPGQFGVSEAGAATYAIPIQVPHGVTGVQPALALVYSSQGGNGLLGVGWNLSGLSSVQRCPRTMAQDGFRGTVDYANDRYCLDGQRLTAISGVDGAHQTEYRTEKESFSKIISYSEAGATNGPGSFIVKTKAGLTMEYGKTTDSRIEAPGRTAVVVWALNKVYDTKGNYLTINYSEDSEGFFGDYAPLSLDWGGNSTTGFPHRQSVKFKYEPRSDRMYGYFVGSARRTENRLAKIEVYGDSILTREYRLTYATATQSKTLRSLLTAVSECTAAGVCKAALKFTYPNTGYGVASSAWTVDATAGDADFTWVGDFNGDGLADITSAVGSNIYVKLSTGSGFASAVWPVSSSWGGGAFTRVGDFNGDGRMDIASASGGSVYMKLSTGTGFTSETWPVEALWGDAGFTWVGDFDADGLADIASAIGGNMYMKLSTGSGFTNAVWPVANSWGGASYTWTADFNGDGRTDIASASGASVYMKLSTGSGFTNETWVVDANWGGADYTWIGDFNGDGLADIASAMGASVHMKLSTGVGFVSEVWASDGLWGEGSYTRTGDFNGDGLSDIASVYGGNMYLKLSTGTGMQSQTIPISNQHGWASYTWVADFDGDGRSDWASWDHGSVFMKIPTGAQDRISTFSSELGAGVSPTYANLSQVVGTLYQKTALPSRPRLVVSGPMPVVTSVQSPDGVGGTRTTEYKYANLLAEAGTGRGVLGFEWTQQKDVSTGTVSRTYFRQDWPYAGLVEKTGKGTSESNWSNLGLTVNTSFFCLATAGTSAGAPCATGTNAPGRRYFIYPNQIDSQAWDYDGTSASGGTFTALPRSRTTQTLDPLTGDATVIKVETLNPDGSATGYSKTITNVYAPVDATKWHLGRLLRSSVTVTAP